MNNLAVVNAFLDDIECLEPITKVVSKVNLFEVLSVEKTEIRHSNLLVWLMRPYGNHGLGDRVLRGIVQSAEEGLVLDYSSFSVDREENRIDIFAVSQKEKVVVCIENKTFSGEHDDQLARYMNYVNATFPEYKRILIYLTRKGKTSSDPDNWMAMSYADIGRIIEEARKEVCLQPEVDLILDNYLDVIRGFGGRDDRVSKICAEVYQKHRKALDLILDCNSEDEDGCEPTEEQALCREIFHKYRKEMLEISRCRPRKHVDAITEAIRRWADLRTEEDLIRTSLEARSPSYERFTTRTMSEILPDAVGCRSGWGTENFYFYEIHNRDLSSKDHPAHDHEVNLQLCTNIKNIPEDLKRASDRMSQVKPPIHESLDHRINFETGKVIFRENAEESVVMEQLDEFLKWIMQFEKELTEGLGL